MRFFEAVAFLVLAWITLGILFIFWPIIGTAVVLSDWARA